MALDYQFVPVNLTGMNTKTDTFVLAPGTASEMKNVWMDKTGEYQTRNGYVELVTTQADAIAISDWYDDVLRWRKTTVDKIDSGIKPTDATFVAGKVDCFDVGGDLDGTLEFGYAEGPAYGVFGKVSTDYTASTPVDIVELQFVDLVSKKVFWTKRITGSRVGVVATATGVGVVTFNTNTIVFDHWVGYSSGYPTRTITSAALKTPVSIQCIDLCHIDGYVAVAYGTTADIRIVTIDLATSTVTDFQLGTDPATSVAICRKSATVGTAVWYDFGTSYAFKYRDFTVPNTPGAAATTIVAYPGTSSFPSRITCLFDGTNRYFVWDWDISAAVAGTYGGAVFNGPGHVEMWKDATKQSSDYRAQIASRLFVHDAIVSFYESALSISTDETNNALCLRSFGTTWKTYSDILFQSRTRPLLYNSMMPHPQVTSSTWIVALPYSGNRKNAAKLVSRTFTQKPNFQYWNGVLMTSVTPHLSVFDGRNVFPAGFPTWPVIKSAAAGAATGLTGTYGYSAIWERVDNEGNVWRSAPSLVAVVTGLSNKDVALSIYAPPFFTEAVDSYKLVLYRTAANGSIFYKLKELDPYVQSTLPVVTTTDSTADSLITSNPILYTDGGILENVMPPSIETFIVARDRLFLISAEDGDVYPSKIRVTGEGLGFNDALRISFNGKKDLNALGAMDEKVIVFGGDTTTVLYGVGPDDLGAGQFETQLISDDFGCYEPRSVVLGDKGLFFQSYKGIFLLTRGLEVEPIGIPMDDYNSETIVGAISPSDRLSTWWYCASGTILVWDEYHERWSRFLTSAASHGTQIGSKPTFLTSTGRVFQEDQTIYQDNGVSYECKITLGWISFAGLQGFQKIRLVSLLGKSQAAAFDCVITLAYDFVTTTFETFTAANATVKPSGTAWQWDFKPKRQKCESVRLDIAWTSSGSGAAITGLAFEAGAIPGISRRITNAKRVGGV